MVIFLLQRMVVFFVDIVIASFFSGLLQKIGFFDETYLISFLVALVYFVFFPFVFGGQTPLMKVFGLKMISFEEGTTLSFRQLVIRFFCTQGFFFFLELPYFKYSCLFDYLILIPTTILLMTVFSIAIGRSVVTVWDQLSDTRVMIVSSRKWSDQKGYYSKNFRLFLVVAGAFLLAVLYEFFLKSSRFL